MQIEGEKILSLLSRLKSHPGKKLYDHLQQVGELCLKNICSKNINISEYLDFNVLKDIVYLIGICHDFGKSTSYFQDYLLEQNEVKKAELKSSPVTHHGFISALFTYYATKQYLSEKNIINNRCYQYLPVISFVVVKKHHGNLSNILDEVIDFNRKNEKVFEKQIESINFNEINHIYKNLFSKIKFKHDCNLFKDYILESNAVYIYDKFERNEKKYVGDLSYQEKRLIRNLDEEDTLLYYFLTLLLYSILLDADKFDAANLKEVERINLNKDVVDRFIEQKFIKNKKEEYKINSIRNNIYKEAINSLDDLNLAKDRIFSLNVPTGTGKTLTSLSFALKLREKLAKEQGFKPRIIYSLPYLSIIDQNFSVFEDVFKLYLNGKQPASDLLLKHHHLSEITYTISNLREEEFENTDPKDIGKNILLIEGWNSEIIVTTFIQLFYSLISNRNRSIRKFHNIINSIIILDEVQAIPHYYWLLLNKIANFMAEMFNTFFVLITATQPLLFDERTEEIKSLVKGKEKHFKSLDRVELILNSDSISLNNFKQILKKDLTENYEKNFLVVLNTVKSSQEIFNFIKELNLKNSKYYYLSTGVIPKIRLERIKDSKIKNRKRKIIVSTQLIEAGVDLDVDIVYRDFAPLDSINQVAGRCNRNFGQKKGIVKIFILKQEDEKREFHKFIYDPFIISKTKDVFGKFEKSIIPEKDFLRLSDLYFDRVNEGKADDKSKEILASVKCLNFEEISKFKLIESDYQKVDVFVELNDSARKIYHKYQEIKEMKNLWERKDEFLKIRKDFYEYVISIPYQYASDFLESKNADYISKISKEEIEQGHYYDFETGFKRNIDLTEGGLLIF